MNPAAVSSPAARPLRADEVESFGRQRSTAASACARVFAQGLSCLSPIVGARTPVELAISMLALGADVETIVDILVTAARSASAEGESEPFCSLAIDAARACAYGFGAAGLDAPRESAEAGAFAPPPAPAAEPVESDADIVIPGSVQDGAVIKAAGSIRVAGNVGAATLEAGGTVTIGGVVHGKDAAAIRCGGDFLARAVDRASVIADGDAVLQGGASYAAIECGGSLYCHGAHGRIVGSTILAGGSVEARDIGAALCDATVVKAGRNPRGEAAQSIEASGRLYPDVRVELGGRFISVGAAYDAVRIVVDGAMLRVESIQRGGKP